MQVINAANLNGFVSHVYKIFDEVQSETYKIAGAEFSDFKLSLFFTGYEGVGVRTIGD